MSGLAQRQLLLRSPCGGQAKAVGSVTRTPAAARAVAHAARRCWSSVLALSPSTLCAPPPPSANTPLARAPRRLARRVPLHAVPFTWVQDRRRPLLVGIVCGCCHTPTAVTECVCTSPHSTRRAAPSPNPPPLHRLHPTFSSGFLIARLPRLASLVCSACLPLASPFRCGLW